MQRQHLPKSLTIASTAIVVAALYFGRDLLIPIALAVLLSFLLSPLVGLVQRAKLKRVPAVVVVVFFATFLIGGLGWIVYGQASQLAERLPEYRNHIKAKIAIVRGTMGGPLAKAQEAVEAIGKEIKEEDAKAKKASEESQESRVPGRPTGDEPFRTPERDPVPVQVIEPPPSRIAQLESAISPVFSVLASAGMVLLMLVFLLIYDKDVRDRVIRLIGGGGQLYVMTQAMDEAARRVSRYLLMQTAINGVYGAVVAIGLYFIGIPNALLFGLLAAAFRFLPYIGPWIGAAFPIMLSLAAFDGWTKPLLTIGLFVVNELISNNVIEPWLYGTNTGVSPLAIIVSAIFWSWIWGPAGLLLATPLTVILVVIGRYVPQLQFLSILFGDEQALHPKLRLYQRLLAMDQEEASEMLGEHDPEKPLEDIFDTVMIPALGLAEADRHRGELDEERSLYVHQAMRELVQEIGDRRCKASDKGKDAAADAAATPAPEAASRYSILCLPARDEADEIAGGMLAQVLETDGFDVEVISVVAFASEMLEVIATKNADLVFVSALPPFASTHTRYLCKRIEARFPNIPLIVGLWNVKVDPEKARSRLGDSNLLHIVTSIEEAHRKAKQLALLDRPSAKGKAIEPPDDPARNPLIEN